MFPATTNQTTSPDPCRTGQPPDLFRMQPESNIDSPLRFPFAAGSSTLTANRPFNCLIHSQQRQRANPGHPSMNYLSPQVDEVHETLLSERFTTCCHTKTIIPPRRRALPFVASQCARLSNHHKPLALPSASFQPALSLYPLPSRCPVVGTSVRSDQRASEFPKTVHPGPPPIPPPGLNGDHPTGIGGASDSNALGQRKAARTRGTNGAQTTRATNSCEDARTGTKKSNDRTVYSAASFNKRRRVEFS